MRIQLEAGERLAVLGPSGAGKTRLLRRLALLDPPGPLRILLQGRAPQAWTIPRYRARVMLVSQHPALFPGSVEQNLREPHRFAVHRGRRFERERVLGWLGALGRAPAFLDREAAELSGGERQLLALVRALQFDPALVLLDEPTASLDRRGRAAVAALLILVNVALSAALRLGLGRRLLLASARMVAQLLLVGTVLEWLFRQRHPLAIAAMALAMTTIAVLAAVRPTRHRFRGIHLDSLLAVLTSSLLVTGLALTGILRPQPWYEPRYLIPLLGMVLGNTLTGISLGLDRLMEGLQSEREQLEARLSLGASRWEACREVVREAVRVGMVPTINSMLVMGLVSLPGMMTGQILAGVSPATAVRYQIVIVFLIAAGTALGVVGVVLLGYLRLTGREHRLRLGRLRRVG